MELKLRLYLKRLLSSWGKEGYICRGTLWLLAAALVLAPLSVAAQSLSELQQQHSTTTNQLQNNQRSAETMRREGDRLADQLALMRREAAELSAQINGLKAQIAEIEAGIADSREVLREYVRRQYVQSKTTPLEMLIGSDSISQFLDNQQYLAASQLRIQELLAEIEAARQKLADRTETLSAKQASLKAQQDKINELLVKTRGEQTRYEAMVRQAKAAQQRVERAIAAMMASGPQKSYGFVHRGQMIGREGNTGFSTGPHLHFGVYLGGHQNDVNPMPYLNSGQLAWPGNYGPHNITQGYNAQWCNGVYLNCRHNGVDMSAGYGSPIRASANGNIIMNNWDAAGFGRYIVIDHGNGLWTLYAHMQNN